MFTGYSPTPPEETQKRNTLMPIPIIGAKVPPGFPAILIDKRRGKGYFDTLAPNYLRTTPDRLGQVGA